VKNSRLLLCPKGVRRMSLRLAAGALALLGVAVVAPTTGHAAAASDGTPDTAFSAATGTGFDSSLAGLVVQTTGKIVAWGSFTQLNGASTAELARLNSNGSPDTAFTTNLGTGVNNTLFAVAVDSTDRLLVGGNLTSLNSVSVGRFARLNADGTPDTTFNAALGTGFDGAVRAIAVQTDGKIVVGGSFTQYQSTAVPRLARLNADGTLDTTFNTNLGTGLDAYVSEIVIDADGRILIGGDFTSLNSASVGRLARLNANGTPDTTFNTALGAGLNNNPLAVTVLGDGKIVVGGNFSQFNGTAANHIVRIGADGTRDTAFDAAFGTNGLDGAVWVILRQYDGEIVIGGSFTNRDSTPVKRVIRLNTDLTWDTAFGTNQGTGFDDEVYALAFQSGGAIVVGGYFQALNEVTSNRIGRLTNDDPKPALPPLGANTTVVLVVGLMVLALGITTQHVARRQVVRVRRRR